MLDVIFCVFCHSTSLAGPAIHLFNSYVTSSSNVSSLTDHTVGPVRWLAGFSYGILTLTSS